MQTKIAQSIIEVAKNQKIPLEEMFNRIEKVSMNDIRKLFDMQVSEKDGEIFISAMKGDACIPALIREIGERVLSVRMQRPTLNDVFLKLTGKEIRAQNGTAQDDIRSMVRSYRRRHDRD